MYTPGVVLAPTRRLPRPSPRSSSRVRRAPSTEARAALASVQDARRTLEELRGLGRGSLRVGASTTPGVYMVPQWLGEFASRYPGVDVHLDIADTRDIEDSLIRRRVDVAVVGEYDAGAELVTTPLGSDVLLPICAPGQEDMPTLDTFLNHRFLPPQA